jgi:hypothetical protein
MDTRMTRWLNLLQELNFTILDKPGKDNVVTDFLSRLTNNSDIAPVAESFSDENLFAVYNHTLWYVDISNYLTTEKLPHHLSPRER